MTKMWYQLINCRDNKNKTAKSKKGWKFTHRLLGWMKQKKMKGSIAKEPLARQLCVDDDKETDADVGVRPHTHTEERSSTCSC